MNFIIKKTFKKITAAVMAATTLAVSMVGMTAFAANTTTNDVISTVETENADNVLRTISNSFSWTNIRNVVTLENGFSLSVNRSVTFAINNCSRGAAIVKLYKYGNATPVRSFSLPEAYMPTQYIYLSLDAGSYYLTVQPQTGYDFTSGSMYIQNIDGITDES